MYASRYVASTVVFQQLFSGYGTHTFKMVSLATSGHPTVAVDKFIIRGNNKVPVEQAEVPAPTPDATATPTAAPATDPTPSLSASPTASPAPATPVPTAVATPVPTAAPTAAPTPTPKPTASPAPTAPPAPPTGGSFYGPGIAADGLANTQVGGTSCGCANLMSSYRFRAGQTADLSSIHIYIIGLGHSGYAAGNGGKMNISIQKDDGSSNHHPSGTALASTTVSGNGLGAFPTIDFAAPASLTAGQLYHVVFKNTDPSPTVNFVRSTALSLNRASSRPARPSTRTWTGPSSSTPVRDGSCDPSTRLSCSSSTTTARSKALGIWRHGSAIPSGSAGPRRSVKSSLWPAVAARSTRYRSAFAGRVDPEP